MKTTFSPNELRVIGALTAKPRKVTDIALELYNIKKMPNANLIINNAIKRINEKCINDGDIKFTIHSDRKLGRLGRTVWKVTKLKFLKKKEV